MHPYEPFLPPPPEPRPWLDMLLAILLMLALTAFLPRCVDILSTTTTTTQEVNP